MANIRKKVKKRIIKTSTIDMAPSKKESKKTPKSKPVVDIIKMKPNNTKKTTASKAARPTATGKSMPKIYGLKLLKGGKQLLRQKRVVAVLIGLFLVATILILSLSTPTGLPEYISNSFVSLSSGDGFPVHPEGGKILYSNGAKNNIFSLTDTNFIGFNKNGNEILTVQHGYDNPSAVVSKERSLVYNYNNKKYFVNNFSSKIITGELENDITLGTISKNGYYAFATKSIGFAGQVDVFNKNSKKVYSWFSASDPISNILLSNNGKKLAVVTVSVSGGFVKSTVSCLKYSSASPIFKYDLNGAVLNIRAYNNGFIVVLQNKVVYYNWNKGEVFSKDFTGDNILFAKVKENGVNLIVRQKGIITNSYIISYNKKHKEKFNLEYNGTIMDIDCYNNLIYILSNRKVTVINSKNEIVRTYELDNIANALIVTEKGDVYAYNDTAVFKLVRRIIMSIVLDLIVVALIAFFVITSAKRGFVKTVLDVVAFFLALYLSITFSGVISEGVYNLFIKDAVVKSIENDAPDISTSLINIEQAIDSMPDFIADAAKKNGISNEGFKEFMASAEKGEGFYEYAVDYVAKPIIVNVLKTILYIVLFIFLCIILKFVARLINKLFSIPIIGGLNKTLGAIFGLVKGTVVAAAFCIAISIIVSLTNDGFLIFTPENIDGTYLFKLLASINPIK